MDGSEILEKNDIISLLSQMKMDHITETIFQYLDMESLSNAEQASELWASVIEGGKVWQKLLAKNVCQSIDWKNMLNSLNTQKHIGLLADREGMIIQHEYKKACFLISQKLVEIKVNWRNGIMTEKRCPIMPRLEARPNPFHRRPYSQYYHQNHKQIFAFNSRWAITAKNDSKIIIRNRFNLDEIVTELSISTSHTDHAPSISTVLANENFIAVCLYIHSEVYVWDVATLNLLFVLDKNLLNRNGNPIHSDFHRICLYGNSLLTMHKCGTDVICNTMYKISTDPDASPRISFKKELPCNGAYGAFAVFMDETNICMVECVIDITIPVPGVESYEVTYRIVTRSVSTFDEICIIDPKTFGDLNSIDYFGGVITVGYFGELGERNMKSKIRFFDAKSGVCLRTVENPLDYYMANLKMIKDQYLITCELSGNLIFWDLKKILDRNETHGFLLHNTASSESYLRSHFDGPDRDGMWIEGDECQIALVGMFNQFGNALYIRDFISNWEL